MGITNTTLFHSICIDHINVGCLLDMWTTIYAKSYQPTPTTSTICIGIIGELFHYQNCFSPGGIIYYAQGLQYTVLNAVCSESESFKLKNVIFETTFLSDSDIQFQCNSDSTYCFGCNLINFVNIQHSSTFNECNEKGQCSAQYFYNATSQACEACHPLCSACTSSANSSSCSECTSSTGISLTGTTCYCLNGYFYKDSSLLCQPCHPICSICYHYSNS